MHYDSWFDLILDSFGLFLVILSACAAWYTDHHPPKPHYGSSDDEVRDKDSTRPRHK